MNDFIASLLGPWSASLCPGAIALRILLSLLLSAVIGCERSSKRHSAGLRTFIVVSLAATTAMLLDLFFGFEVPVLSAAAIIGMAILSSNSILFSSKNQIKGLTTSAGLWACGMIGLTVGAGVYTLSLTAFFALLCSLSLFPMIEKRLKDRSNHFEIHLELKNKSNLQDFVTTMRRLGVQIDDIEVNPAYLNSGLSVFSVAVTIVSPELKKYKRHDEIIEALRSLDYVYYIEEMT